MECSCCGRKKRLFESFEDIGKGGNICVECSDILYHMHDAATEKNKEEYQLRKKTIEDYFQKKSSKKFKIWFETDFLVRNQIDDE